MSKRITLSRQTRKNWLIDAAVFGGAIGAMLSGIYFLFLPSGGYQGGRNPLYGITILFDRHTWGDLHAWAGVIMIAAVMVHLVIHWGWIKMMARRIGNALLFRETHFSRGAKINVAVDAVIGISFLLTAISGIYFLFMPEGGHQDSTTIAWDTLHTWAGVILILAAVAHFIIHWRWIKNVTRRFFLSLWQRPRIPNVNKAGTM